MTQEKKTPEDLVEDRPPIMGSWKRLYWLVILLHTVIIFLFYLFTTYYS